MAINILTWVKLIEGCPEMSKKDISWKACREKKEYANFLFRCAEDWARLMEEAMSKGQKLDSVDVRGSLDLVAEQYSFAGHNGYSIIYILIETWKHGTELEKWFKKSKLFSGSSRYRQKA